MEWFIAVVVVAALGVAAMVAAGGMGEMRGEPVRDYYRQDLPTDRSMTSAEIDSVRFAVTLRGYSMAQVDDLLEQLSGEIAARDEQIRMLSGLLAERLAHDHQADLDDRADAADELDPSDELDPIAAYRPHRAALDTDR